MIERLKRSWRLAKNSFQVLRKNKKLMLFPMISSLGLLGIVLFFGLTVFACCMAASDIENKGVDNALKYVSTFLNIKIEEEVKNGKTGKHYSSKANVSYSSESVSGAAVLFIIYIFSMFLATFFNVAFYSEIIQALNGNDVSIVRGFKFACSHIVPIIMWSFFAGIVGYIIKSLEEHFGFVGKIIMSFIGMAWSVASVFAIPVIIREGKSINPISYLKKSALIIKNTWGESLAGYLGFGGISGILIMVITIFVLLMLLPLGIFISAFSMGMIIPAVMIVGIWLLSVIAIAFICDIMEKIYFCSLYIYASEGVIPEAFSQEDMDSAWKIKKTK